MRSKNTVYHTKDGLHVLELPREVLWQMGTEPLFNLIKFIQEEHKDKKPTSSEDTAYIKVPGQGVWICHVDTLNTIVEHFRAEGIEFSDASHT